MNLVVVSHKICWPSKESPTGFSTDGGFPFHMEAISELFARTTVVVPCENAPLQSGVTPLIGGNLEVVRLAVPSGAGLRRKLAMSFWIVTNGKVIWRQVKNADAVHTPIPGDVGTIGMLFALMLRKPLFVRHCGNWFVQRTIAEKFWKWSMEFFGGGRNVMFATGGSSLPPSQSNSNIRWIFSSSLRRDQIAGREPLTLPADGRIRLAIACRQEARKGTDIVLDSMPDILRAFPDASLDVIGDGSLLATLKLRVQDLGLKDKVRFHGKLEHAKVISLLKQNHVFCYPTSASEGFPKVVLEALACGMPVITTRVSVLPDLISSGCGVLLDSPSPISLSNAVIEVCSDQAKYKDMSSKAISTAQKYSLEDWRDFIGETLREAWSVSTLS